MSTISDFLDYLRLEKRFSPHTVNAYQSDLNQFAAYLDSRFDMSDISEAGSNEIRSWLFELKNPDNGKPLGSRSINRKISSLRTYFKYLKRNAIIRHDPMIKISGPKTEKRLPVFVEEKEIRLLLEHLKEAEGFSALRDRVIIEMLYATGMRRSELIALKFSDIDHSAKSIKVLGKGNKERIIPVSDEMLDLISEYRKVRKAKLGDSSDVLLVNDSGKPLNPREVYRTVNRLIGTVSAISKKSPHVLRHSFATHLLNNGSPLNAIKELLGHSNLAATQIYTHGKIEELKEVYKQTHPRSEKKQ